MRRARVGRFKLVSKAEPPQGAVYLNIAQYALERRFHFDWLRARPDIKPVFFLHDLLPLDYPEFWPAGHKQRFVARMDTLFGLARGVITSSEAVARRVVEECARRGTPPPPILARSLTSPLQSDADAHDAELAATPYFLMVGTIEPRKNHLTVLNLWRAIVESGYRGPKLVLVGGRGWLNDETTAMLDRCCAFEGFVAETSGLGDKALRTLISNARALLAPSFAEGYGLPITEALELGAPVIASKSAGVSGSFAGRRHSHRSKRRRRMAQRYSRAQRQSIRLLTRGQKESVEPSTDGPRRLFRLR